MKHPVLGVGVGGWQDKSLDRYFLKADFQKPNSSISSYLEKH